MSTELRFKLALVGIGDVYISVKLSRKGRNTKVNQRHEQSDLPSTQLLPGGIIKQFTEI